MADNVDITPGSGETIATDEITIDGALAHVQRVKIVHGAPGSGSDASGTSPLPVRATPGTFGYDAGVAAATVDVPANARVCFVSVLAGASAATIVIAGGDTITVPAGAAFDRAVEGDVTLGADVVLGGDVDAYYVEWKVVA